MDLKHDWKILNDVLFQGRNLDAGASSLVLLEDGDKIVDGVVSNGKAFVDVGVQGASQSKDLLDGLAAKYGTDQAMVLSKKMLDQAVAEAASLGTNYYQQLQMLRERVTGAMDRSLTDRGRALEKSAPRSPLIVSRRHFVLDLFGKTLRRILQRRFNVLLFVDQRPSLGHAHTPFTYRAILMSYSGGQLDQFFEPDFSSLHENRLKNWQNEADAIGQYLESRYILPTYAIFMHKEDWDGCMSAASVQRKPWRQFVRYYDEKRAAVYPLKFITKALLATQRIMVYFGRL